MGWLRKAFKKLGRGVRKGVKKIGKIAPGVVSGFVLGGPFGAVAGAVSGLTGGDIAQQALAGAGVGVLGERGVVGGTVFPWLQSTYQKVEGFVGNLLGGPFARPEATSGVTTGPQSASYDDYLGDVYGGSSPLRPGGTDTRALAGMAPGGGLLDQKTLLLIAAGIGLFFFMKK